MTERILETAEAMLNREAVKHLIDARIRPTKERIACAKAGIMGERINKQRAMNEHNWGAD